MEKEFKNKIELFLKDFFTERSFRYEKSVVQDGGNKEVIYYRSKLCTLAFYQSIRNGEVNCMVNFINGGSNDIEEKGWIYINSFLGEGVSLSVDELLARVPNVPRSFDEQLKEIVNKLLRKFDFAANKNV